jgi:hypothetical protein
MKVGIKIWLRGRVAAHKIPGHVFWIGEEDDFSLGNTFLKFQIADPLYSQEHD